MDWIKELYDSNEKPLDRLVDGYSNTSVFRTIAFIGDSLSSGEFETRTESGTGYHDLYEYSWGQYIARKNGLKAYNFSRGGMTAKEYIESFADANGMFDEDKKCQAYVIALGVNDVVNRGMEIGTVDDIGTQNETFLRYYGEIVNRYKSMVPDAKFFFVSFPNMDNNAKVWHTDEVNAAIYSMAEYFDNAYVIDLQKYGPVYDDTFRQHFFMHGHMNPSGYIFTARIIDSYIDYIVRHNPQDFSNVGFICTDIKY
ncbi:MAG: SGNH/GDSL hydrolase family protein [Clostridia bacterium]|nr:SGNH/GDSL hydrolase family protein [Clostridia bacterium]